jgi:3-oxoacyl-[acyl-carrier protein] reductase
MSTERTTVITGAGRGIGKSIAIAFASRGDHVILVSRTGDELDTVASEIGATGGTATAMKANVGSAEEVDRLFEDILSLAGKVDVLVNSAGIIGAIGLAWEVEPDEWWDAVTINLLGTYLCCRAAMKSMARRGSGSVINLSGGGATSPSERISGYGASKAAVVRLTETLAVESWPFGVRVNAISPGMVDTGMHDDVLAAGEHAGARLAAVQRMRSEKSGVQPEEAAELALWLASTESEPMSGKLISAQHDLWREWTGADVRAISESGWMSLRRIDKFTLDALGRTGAV